MSCGARCEVSAVRFVFWSSLVFFSHAWAAEVVNVTIAANHSFSWSNGGPVLGGMDVMSYHYSYLTGDAAMVTNGTAEYSFDLESSGHIWTFWFSDEFNLLTFSQDPWRYAPRLGGFSVWGLANEWHASECACCVGSDCNCRWPWTADTIGPPVDEQNVWAMVNGKLYFAFLPWLLQDAVTGGGEMLLRAEERWLRYYGSEAGPFNTGCFQSTWASCGNKTLVEGSNAENATEASAAATSAAALMCQPSERHDPPVGGGYPGFLASSTLIPVEYSSARRSLQQSTSGGLVAAILAAVLVTRAFQDK
mmetsp:Transcript_60335/g.143747  ORF Transcript_60335/g.143747 Transcript_60335/m.143747 type:complete len:306 (-) Transcript_60335:63-980(-)